jgi:hydroxypyruvate isomerase
MMNLHSTAVRRRGFLAALGAFTAFSILRGTAAEAPETAAPAARRKGRLKQAVCRGVFKGSNLDLDGMCREAARLGAGGIDLVDPPDFPVLQKHGLVPTMVHGGSTIKNGINDARNHDEVERKLRESIKAAAAAGAPNVILLAGDRKGLSDEQGQDNCVAFLDRVKAQAEDQQVTLCMELLNSKVNHPGYMCDHTAWGVAMCKRVNSPRVKLLYDIYHMQIMEGDVIRTIRDNYQYLGHFHTAGNPGRHEFDDSQELNYVGICKAIADLGFQGYLAHEYTPTKAALPTLDRMMGICEV